MVYLLALNLFVCAANAHDRWRSLQNTYLGLATKQGVNHSQLVGDVMRVFVGNHDLQDEHFAGFSQCLSALAFYPEPERRLAERNNRLSEIRKSIASLSTQPGAQARFWLDVAIATLGERVELDGLIKYAKNRKNTGSARTVVMSALEEQASFSEKELAAIADLKDDDFSYEQLVDVGNAHEVGLKKVFPIRDSAMKILNSKE